MALCSGSRLNIASICAGIGGLDLSIQLVFPRASTVLFCERETYAASTLVARMEDQILDPAPVCDSMSDIGPGWRGSVDLIAAGLPCQPYSGAGKQRGHEDERAIWPEFIDLVERVRPSLVFIENVPLFLRFFRPVGEALSCLGYQVEEPVFITAEETGASHKRERLFILAHNVANYKRQRWRQVEQSEWCEGASDKSIRERSSLAYSQDRDWWTRIGGEETGTWKNEIGRRGPTECGGELALPKSGGLRELREPSGGYGLPDGGREQLADSSIEGLEERGRAGWGPGQGTLAGLVQASPDLADSGDGLFPESGRGPEGRDGIGSGGTDLGLFAPGRTDWNAWRSVLVREPLLRPALSQTEIESLVCGVADGTPNRLDSPYKTRPERLRCLGNAVSPLSGAVALSLLLRKAGLLR